MPIKTADPSLGYLHVSRPGRQALVYDLMEPNRPHIDREILSLVRSRTFTPRDFVIDSSGVCRLHPELSKHVVDAVMPSLRDVAPLERVMCTMGDGLSSNEYSALLVHGASSHMEVCRND